jgi:hypothetical protein
MLEQQQQQQPITTYYMYNGHKIKSETIPPPPQSQELEAIYAPPQQPQTPLVIKPPTPLTAYPGDIFYKVKDVTESSTSDTLENTFVEDKNQQQGTTTWKKKTITTNNTNNDEIKVEPVVPVVTKELHAIR